MLVNKLINKTFKPDSEVISERVCQLISFYGKEKVKRAFITKSKDSELSIHVSNLILTYGNTQVLDVYKMFFKTILVTKKNKRWLWN